MYKELNEKTKRIGVIGLGYVGLPIALEFAKYFSVIGFDINEKRVDMMRQHTDPSNELDKEAFAGKDIEFTSDIENLRKAHFYIVAVPTPVDDHKVPDLKPVLSASATLGKVVKNGDYIIFESTVYPGCTEEDCRPVIEQGSGLKVNIDFKLGYSPERIVPGDRVNTIDKITKIVSGSDEEALEEIAKVYGKIITAGIHKAPSIKVAEAAKVVENTQRDINISLMNELSIIFDRMDIDTLDVIKAAGTKWNFLKFYPGLVGGHCIGVDPYYLTYKSKQLGYDPQVISSGRRINDEMPIFVAKKTVQFLIKAGKDPRKAKVLVLGMTFKENVSDIRNSKIADLIEEMKSFSLNISVIDPMASKEEVFHEYGIELADEIQTGYDAVIIAVNHKSFQSYESSFFKSIMNENPILIDIKGAHKLEDKDIFYWRL